MKFETMLAIDKYIGVPLIFLSSMGFKILKKFKLIHTKKITPQNVLIIELSEMGSVILLEPGLQKLKKNLNGNLYFLIFKSGKQALNIYNTIEAENIYTIDDSSLIKMIKSSFNYLKWCRKKKIDTVVELELFSRFSSLLTLFSGAKNMIGFDSFRNEGLYKGNFLTTKVVYNLHQHISKTYMTIFSAVLNNKKEYPYGKKEIKNNEIYLKKAEIKREEKENVKSQIKKSFKKYKEKETKIAILNPNSSRMLPQRRWEMEKYGEIAKKILDKRKDYIVVITGSPSEKQDLNNLIKYINNKRCINLAGEIKFRELLALYDLSEFIITNDSGPAHFSAATNIKSYVIFGPETPTLYKSIGNTTPISLNLSCSPCVSAFNHRSTPCLDNQCIKNLSVELVYSYIKKHIE